MEIEVRRVLYDEGVTFSKIYIDGVYECFGLEDPKREKKVHSETAIPDGVYKLDLRYSPKFSSRFNHNMLWVRDVPNFEYILIHWGNTTVDTAGCLLLGKRLGVVKGRLAILDSITAYTNFYKKVNEEVKKGGVTIEYKTI